MWSLISILVTYMGFFKYLFLNSQYSRLCPKTTKNTGKTHCREAFWQPKCEGTETHAAAYTAFSKGMHVRLVTPTGSFLYLSLK